MKVKELLSDESKWTQRTYAKDANGEGVMWCVPEAVCWCLHGAIAKCYRGDFDRYERILGDFRRKVGLGDLWGWNDAPERTFAEVKALVEELDI